MKTALITLASFWLASLILLWWAVKTAVVLDPNDLSEANGDTEPLPQEGSK